MVRVAPRYDPLIDRLVGELDDRSQSMAETCRQVAARAEQLGLARPSLVHLRTLVRAERDRAEAEQASREQLRELALDTTAQLLAGRVPDPDKLIDRIGEARRLGKPR